MRVSIGVSLALGTALFLAASDTPVLRPGVPVQREIRGDETQSFRIPAGLGQFVHVQVDQQGADVLLRLFDPSGNEIGRSDLPNADWGPEVVATIAESTGDYTVSISMLDTKVPPGKYEIRLLALRDASAADRERASAEAIAGRAENLRRQSTAAAQQQAAVEYQKALPFFESSGELYRAALMLNSLGLIYARKGDMTAALPYYERALGASHDAGDPAGEGRALNNLGGAYDVLGDLPKARDYYERALVLFRAAGNHIEESNTLSNIGKLLADESDRQKGIEYYRQALAISDRAHKPTILSNLGTCYLQVGEYETARDYLTRALEARRELGDQTGQAVTLDDLGSVALAEHHDREALDDYQQALTLFRTRGNRRGEAQALYHLGRAYARVADTTKALNALGQSVDLFHTAGDRRLEALAFTATADVYTDSGQPAKALEYASRAIETFRVIGDRDSEGQALLGLAKAQRALNRLTEARRNTEESLARLESARTSAGAGEARAFYLATNENAYGFTIDLLMQLGNAAAAFDTSERARARSLLEMLSESHIDIRQGADPKLLARERELADLLNARGTRLLPIMGRDTPQAAALKQEIRSLETEYQAVEAGIRESSPQYAALTQPSPLQLKQVQDQLLDNDSLLLEYSLGEQRSFLWMVGKDAFHTWELPPRDKIESQVTAVYELLTARSASVRMETPAARQKRIEAADAAFPDAARRLSEMVLAPAASSLAGKRLIIVPDGALQRLPFAILPLPGSAEPLLATHELVVVPSASAASVLRTELGGRPSARRMLAVFADPVFDASDSRLGRNPPPAQAAPLTDSTRILQHLVEGGGSEAASLRIPRLPFTAQEAGEVLKVGRGGDNWSAEGFAASRAAALSGRLSQYRFIHFATHGLLDTERPSLSALVLSQIDERGNPEDGFLRVNDIYNMRLSADLVVLSACQTGLGKEVRGEGLMGLTRAFLYAGAPRMIVSLWNVNDRATAGLMADIYRGMLRKGERPATALRAAQLELRKQKRWESPYYWAAFVQYGEWR